MTVAEFINKVGFQVDQNSVSEVNKTIDSIKSTAANILGAIGIGVSLAQLNQLAEEFNQINDRINYIVDAEHDAHDVQQSILEAANACKASYGDMASAVTSLVNSNADLFPVEDATTFVEYINKLGLSAGYSEGEINSMHSSLQRIFAAGEAGSANIQMILRSTPALAKQLADSFGVATDELVNMADRGELTAEAIKNAILSSTDAIDIAFNGLDYSISDALLNIRNQWGFWVDSINSSLGLTQSIAKLMVAGFNKVMVILNQMKQGFMTLADKLGGTENLLRLIAFAAAAILIAMNFSKIIAGIQLVGQVLKAAFSIKNIGLLALIAAILVLFLVVDDFVNFMKGNNSVLGVAFQKAGIDADEMRRKIINIWNNLKTFFAGIWNSIKATIAPVLDWIKKKLSDVFGDELFAGLGRGVAGVIEFFERLTAALAGNTALQDALGKIVVGVLAVVAAFAAIKTVTGIAGALGKVGSAVSGAGKTAGAAKSGFSGFASALLMAAAAIAVLAFAAIQIAKAGPGAVVAIIAMVGGLVGLMAVAGAFADKMNGAASGLVAFGGAVLMAAAGFAIMTFTAIQLSNAGGAAIAVFAGMAIAIAALLAIAGALGSSLTAGAAGLAAFGAALLLSATAAAILTNVVITLIAAGAPAIALFAGMTVALAGLLVLVAILGPALTAGAVGMLAFGAALLMVGAAAALGAASLAIVSAVLPTIVEYGTSGAAALIELGLGMTAFAAGAALAGVGVGVAAVAFAANRDGRDWRGNRYYGGFWCCSSCKSFWY